MSEPLTQSKWSELERDILIRVYEKLSYKDSVRLTCVCRNWRSAINKEVPCLLLHQPDKKKPWFLVRHGSRASLLIDHSDCSTPVRILPALERIYNSLEEKDFAEIHVLASKAGWVLLKDNRRSDFCCFNVFNSDAIRLPSLGNLYDYVPMRAAFSDVPTSQDSVIFLIRQITQNSVEIKTFRRGSEQWSSKVYPHSKNIGQCQDVVRSKGKFYCIFGESIGIFENENQFHYFEPKMPWPKCPLTTTHLAESDGEILATTARGKMANFPAWKLDLEKMEFEAVEKLGDRAFFMGFGSSSICAKCDTESFMDKVLYPGDCSCCCWFMSGHDRVRTLCESFPWIVKNRSKLTWIQRSS